MDTSNRITRRRLVQVSLAGLAVLSGQALAGSRGPTPAQTEGPFFPTRDQTDKDIDLTRVEGHTERASGEVVEVSGQVLDEAGQPIADALVDVWQANTHGRYAHERDPNPAPLDENFQGWARITTDSAGLWRIRTIKPGAYPVREGWSRPPHIHFKVAKRGFIELTTQMYFAGEALNDVDRLLQAVPEAERTRIVVAFAPQDGDAPALGHFEIVLSKV